MATLFTTQAPDSLNATYLSTRFELGLEFQSAKTGQITAIRYWKASSDTGTRTGKLWSATGTLLKSVNFTNETGSGWQEQAFDTPVLIQANTTYIVSVNCNGYYSATQNGLASAVVNGDLRSVADGSNGVYNNSPGLFPNESYNSTNYFRDIVFTANSSSSTLSKISGDNQSGTVGTTLANPLVVQVASGGAPQAGVTVSFTVTGGSSVSPTSAVTNANGRASTRLTLGTTAGAKSVNVSAVGISTVSFTATANPATATILALTPTSTTSRVNTPVNYQATVQDQYGNTVTSTNPTVTFAATGLSGSFSPGTTVAANNGRAPVTFTASANGAGTIRATATGFPTASAELTISAANPIFLENQKTGTRNWQITNLAENNEIAGYATATSVNLGGSLPIKVSLTTSGTYQIDVYRLGYYGGMGGRFIKGSGSLSGITQPECQVTNSATRLVECNWATSYTLAVGSDWTTGLYIAKLTEHTGKQSQVWFVVRDDNSRSDLLFQSCFTTFQAYNSYGGYSLYPFSSLYDQAAFKVSFDRPFSQTTNKSGEFNNILSWEYNMVRWLEAQGYDISYVTNLDVHVNPQRLEQHKVFLSVGHDEYWSMEQRDGVEQARDAGVNLAFFTANAAYWRVRFENSSAGQSNRVMVCYKDAWRQDPIAPTGLFRDPEGTNRPENALLGVMYVAVNPQLYGGANFIVTDSSDPYYANTGLNSGQSLGSLVGYEWDAIIDNGFSPPGLVTLSESLANPNPPSYWVDPYVLERGYDARLAHAVHYTHAGSGAKVFSVGTIQWMWGLDSDNIQGGSRVDQRVQQITVNVLAAMNARPLSPATGLIVPQ